jgi:putative phosphoesterase
LGEHIILGLIADTHVPDRKRDIDPAVFSIFKEAEVSTILHAGDISTPPVLAQLERVAPVLAVRGNRDWFGFKDLPMARLLEFGGKRIALTHGHVNWPTYARDKLAFFLRGPQRFDFFAQRVAAAFEGMDAVIFGHNHEPMIKTIDGKLIINPGSACCQVLKMKPPSVALLHIEDGELRAEIKYLS